MTVGEIEKMTVRERLQALEALWDSLAHLTDESLSPPKWHCEVTSERVNAIRAGTAEAMTLDELAALKNAQY